MHPNSKASMENNWPIDLMKKLYDLRHNKKKTFKEISKILKMKNKDSLNKKYKRTNWDEFLKNPEDFTGRPDQKKWTNEEMIQLDAFLQSGQSYDFIAKRMNRSMISIERKAQDTDWKAWRSIKEVAPQTEDADTIRNQEIINRLVTALLERCRYEPNRVEEINEKDFLERINFDKSKLTVSFREIKKMAKAELNALGFSNPEELNLENGTYVIVGDSHGKHTNKAIFALLENINKTIKPNKIIHVGHILDDDNDISYDWGRFNNLVVLSKVEELRTIQEQRNKFKFKYDIVREEININDLIIVNQDLISDYVKAPISSLDTTIFDDKVIVNCHRLEFSTRCCNDGASYFASPGCLCEHHIIRTVKQIDFEDGRTIKQANHDSFIKYRRMKHTNNYWERGLLIVNMDKNNNYTIVPCPIKETKSGFAISYFDKIITSKGVFNPDNKIFVNADMHCDKHDAKVLDIQEQICKDYKPDIQVNLGDTLNYHSLNHHIMDRGGVITDKKIIDEAARAHYVLKRVSKWAKKSYIIYGNHERFSDDFVERYPQFEKFLDIRFMCDIDALGYELIPLKKSLKIGSAQFVHGEIKMYGQNGSKLEKASRTFGRDIFVGHVHKPEIRFGSYSVGLTGELDQEYNEPDASNWLHGIGLCNQFNGVSFLTTIAIVNNRCVINNKTYKEINPESWNIKDYNVRIVYDC